MFPHPLCMICRTQWGNTWRLAWMGIQNCVVFEKSCRGSSIICGYGNFKSGLVMHAQQIGSSFSLCAAAVWLDVKVWHLSKVSHTVYTHVSGLLSQLCAHVFSIAERGLVVSNVPTHLVVLWSCPADENVSLCMNEVVVVASVQIKLDGAEKQLLHRLVNRWKLNLEKINKNKQVRSLCPTNLCESQ